MDLQKIKILLQKYYDGSASNEEEDLLTQYFLDNEVPEELTIEKEQILGFTQLKDEDIPIPANLSQTIKDALEPLQADKKVRRLSSRMIYSSISVAASVLIIMSALIFMNKQPDLGSFDDPEMAYAETKDALDLVTKYFSKGTSHIASLNKMEEAVKPLNSLEKVETPQQTLHYLKSFDQGLQKLQGLVDIEKIKE